jgi:hypothetical protein
VRGKQPHPRINDVEALATFSGVPVTYFFDDDVTARIEDQIAQVRTSAGDVGGLVTTRSDTSVPVTVDARAGALATVRNGRDGDCPVGVRAVDCRAAG